MQHTPDIVLRAEGLGKEYRIGRARGNLTLGEEIGRRAVAVKSAVGRVLRGERLTVDSATVWALQDVSFEVARGEVLGIVGANGAGKTTLLKVLSRVTRPTVGRADIWGRVGSLLEVGTGFHPELTGRENIYLNGAILGLRKEEIDRKFDDIVGFAEVQQFLDTPVKHYSSGMYVRLAFAVAAHLEPSILIVDEVLAVGDAAFQERCLGRMSEVARSGRTVLFVSHNMAAIEALCSRAMLIERGRVSAMGSTSEIVRIYLQRATEIQTTSLRDRDDRQGDGRLRLTNVALLDEHGEPCTAIASGQQVTIAVDYETEGELRNVSLAIGWYDIRAQFYFYCENEMVGQRFARVPARGRLLCSVARFPLAPGGYFLNLYCEVNDVVADWVQRALPVTVVPGDFYGTGKLPPPRHGGVLADQEWSLVSAQG